MLAPELDKTFIIGEFSNLQGKVNLPGSPIFVGNLSIIIEEHSSLITMVDDFSNSFQFSITSLVNLGIFPMVLRKGVLIQRDSIYSMNFLCSTSNRFFMAQDG